MKRTKIRIGPIHPENTLQASFFRFLTKFSLVVGLFDCIRFVPFPATERHVGKEPMLHGKSHMLFTECGESIANKMASQQTTWAYIIKQASSLACFGSMMKTWHGRDRVTSGAKTGAWYHYYHHTKTTSRMVPTTLQVDKLIWFERGPRCMLVLSFYNHIDHNKRTSLDGLSVKSTKKGIKVPCDTRESTHVSKYKGPSR